MRRRDSDNRINLTGQWGNSFPLPSRNSEPNFLIAAPNPDPTIGYNGENVGGYYKARDHLGDHCSPVKCDKQLLFPVVTVEVKSLNSDAYAQRQNMRNGAIMVRNLRNLRQQAGMEEEDLKIKFDGIAHVVTISFTQTVIHICCGWSQIATDGHLEFFSKVIAVSVAVNCFDDLHSMAEKIRNAADWAIDSNKQWIRDDLANLQPLVSTLPPLEPEASLAGSQSGTEMTGE